MQKNNINYKDVYKKYIKENKSIEIVSQEIGCCYCTMQRFLKEHKLYKKKKHIQISDQALIEFYIRQDFSISKLAKKYKLSYDTMKWLLSERQIKKQNNPLYKPKRVSNRKTSKNIEIKIVKDYINNITVKELSKKYNLSGSTIRRILKDNNLKLNSRKEKYKKLCNRHINSVFVPQQTPIKNKHGKIVWRVICKCSKEIYVETVLLSSKRKISCGCSRRPGKNSKLSQYTGDISGALWSKIKANATCRNLEFTITRKYIWNIWIKQNGKCAISGIPITLGDINNISSNKGRNASLDRIDSSRGYIKGNVQWVLIKINRMKMNLSELEFFDLCKTISDYKFNKKV